MKRNIIFFVVGVLTAFSLTLLAQSSSENPGESVESYSVTNYPLYGTLAAQSDSADFNTPRALRADAAGQVTVSCWRGTVANSIELNLAAGEFVPCQVRRLWDTGTDAIAIHMFY